MNGAPMAEPGQRHGTADILAVGGVAVGYAAMELCGLGKLWSYAFLLLALLAFATWLYRRGGEDLRAHGLVRVPWRQPLRVVGAATLLAAAAMAAIAIHAGHALWRPSLGILLVAYPPFGVCQQWAFQGVLHRRLRQRLPAPLAAVVTALAFAAVHVGYRELVLWTAVAGLFWSWAWARWPNTWLVGASHGVLASLAYPWLLGDDPLARIGG